MPIHRVHLMQEMAGLYSPVLQWFASTRRVMLTKIARELEDHGNVKVYELTTGIEMGKYIIFDCFVSLLP